MFKIQFRGCILPVARTINISESPEINNSTESGLEIKNLTVQAHQNILVVNCEVNRWDQKDQMNIYMECLEVSRGIVDLIAFQTGTGLTTILHTLIDPNGKSLMPISFQPKLAALSTALHSSTPLTPDKPNVFDTVSKIVLSDIALVRALRDLVDAISEIHVGPLVCGRAMEGLRHSLAPNEGRKIGWEKLREAVKVDRAYLDMITDESKGPRHADPKFISADKFREITVRSWIIMNRFLEYRKRGSTPLPDSEFPLLTG